MGADSEIRPDSGLTERATMQQVAAEAGVSIATVSRVLNSPDSVSPELLGRVQLAVQRLGYRPNRTARGLRGDRSIKRVGFVVSNIQNPFFTDILKGVEQTLIPDQVAVLVGNSNNDLKYEQLNLDLMLEEQASGLIVHFASNRPKNYMTLVQSGVPVVCIDQVVPGMPMDSVVTDNCEAMRQATQHLLQLGHRRFAFVGGPLEYMTARERQRGFVSALEDAGLGPDDYTIENGEWQLGGFYVAASRLLDRIETPVALLTVNNDATIATLKIIRERGLRIPEDVALVCFDEMPWTDAYNPPLTVVDQHPYHIGAVAAELLLSRMRNPDRPMQQVILECSLVVRQSCGTSIGTIAEKTTASG